MILNKNNYFARYYNWIYGNYPKEICSFFWGSVMIILLAPVLVTGKLIILMDPDNTNDYQYGLQTLLGASFWLIYALISCMGALVLSAFGYEFINVWAMLTGGFGIGVLTILVVVAFIWGLISLLKKTSTVLPETHVVDNTVDFIAAIKGKYCTRITWTDKN